MRSHYGGGGGGPTQLSVATVFVATCILVIPFSKETEMFEVNSKLPTWDELVAIEPRLDELLNEVRKVKDDGPYFCIEDHVCGIRNDIYRLVGWGARGD